MSDRPDFAKARISGAGEWALLREAYAETYPVRPLINHVDELKELVEFAIEYVRVDIDTIEEWHMHPDSKRVEPPEVADDIEDMRAWIRKAEAAIK